MAGTDLRPLTPAQTRLFDWLEANAAAGGTPPTLDETCRALGLRSRGSLHKQLGALVEHGLVEPMAGRRRGIRLTTRRAGAHPSPHSPRERGAASPLPELPLLGRIAAGAPIEAVAEATAVEVPPRLLGRGECYVLQVRGDSMVEAGIHDGDEVVIERRDSARDGDVVVALVDGDSATLKRIEQRPGECVLWPANGEHRPQSYAPDRVAIQGVLVGLMRAWR